MINSISEITQIWDRSLMEIKRNIGDSQVFDSLFSDSYIYEVSGNTIKIVVNTRLSAKLISTKYNEIVTSAINKITQSNFNIDVLAEPDIAVSPAIQEAPVQQKKMNYFPDAKLNTKLTFDTFVVGGFNREASQASLLIAKNPGKMFNPLFMYSHSGLGKTHLLHAIGNYIVKEGNPNAKILYISAEAFIEEYIKFVRGEKDSESLKNYVSSFDVLLFDDIQFLANKVKTLEMFFHIFQAMKDNDKQIVITSDKQPNELKDLEERLITRFNQGLVVSIDEPDQNTCVEILRKKIESSGLDLEKFDGGVLYFFADKFSKNVRELEGALNRLMFYVVSLKQTDRITMEVAAEAVQSLVGGNAIATQLNEQKIINIVADYYNLVPSQLTGKIRTGQIALARHIAMYLIRYNLDVSLKKIGDMFGGKDHTTVINAIQKVEKELKTSPQLEAAIEELTKKIK